MIPQRTKDKLIKIIDHQEEKSTQQLRKLNNQLNKLTIDNIEPPKNSFFSTIIQQLLKIITPSYINQEASVNTVTLEKRESFKQFKQQVRDISQSKLKADDKPNEADSSKRTI